MQIACFLDTLLWKDTSEENRKTFWLPIEVFLAILSLFSWYQWCNIHKNVLGIGHHFQLDIAIKWTLYHYDGMCYDKWVDDSPLHKKMYWSKTRKHVYHYLLRVYSFKAKNRVFEFDFPKMNMFESFRCSKNDVWHCFPKNHSQLSSFELNYNSAFVLRCILTILELAQLNVT